MRLKAFLFAIQTDGKGGFAALAIALAIHERTPRGGSGASRLAPAKEMLSANHRP